MPALSSPASMDQLTAEAAALAEAVSLAIRVEPQLLRNMRLALFPMLDAGAEADLWFSPVVETRTSSSIVLYASVREELRQQLGSNREALETAWTITEALHREISPALLAEERLAYLTLAGKHEDARELLRSVVATLVSPRGRGLAGWAAQAADRLPEVTRPLEEAQMLTVGASLRLGSGVPSPSGISSARASEWAAWLSPEDLEMVPFGVALLEDAVEFGPVGRPSSHRIDLPRTVPLVVELAWSEGVNRRSERTALSPNALTLVELGPGVTEIDLRTVLGDSYLLTVPEARERGSTQQKLNRVRAPRVRIGYDGEEDGAIRLVDLPFIVAVLADLSGSKTSEAASFRDRPWIDIDNDNFDAVLKGLRPRLILAAAGKTGSKGGTRQTVLEFQSMLDFTPAALARQMQSTQGVLEQRTLLAEVRSMMLQDEAMETNLTRSLAENSVSSVPIAVESAPTADAPSSETMVMVLQRSGSATAERAQTLASALSQNVWLPPGSANLAAATAAKIAEMDAQLSAALNEVLHHPAFQALEATWRGLQYLVQQTETSAQLKIRLWDITKSELAKDSSSDSRFDETVAFRRLHDEQYGVYREAPISLMVGAYEFDRSHKDVALLESIGAIAAAGHAPFVAAASPAVLELESFTNLGEPRDLAKLFDTDAALEWKRLRDSDEAGYLALTLPHIMLRLPYGSKTMPVEEFDFEEAVDASQHSHFLWGNAAFALAARITGAFALYGWPASIRGVEGGGLVEGLPTYDFSTEDGDVALKCPTEVPISDRRGSELSVLGLIPLCFYKGTDTAAFISVNSIKKPAVYLDDEANSSARDSVGLPYILSASRFAQYIQCIARDQIGSFRTPEDTQRFLNAWISAYVQPEPNLSITGKARYPLQSARVEVQEVDDRMGGMRAVLFLRPDFQLDPLSTEMRLVVDLPNRTNDSIPV